eukprot:TRINITY_DN4652_c0_g1_i3.p1 TRINITY_DN4652_c0_g1~~TRINITY_DN4652_c0_g1_i3.p1  ORF type:complete len:607 (-),score=35.10 TRINITY_DN4652_c0_g1_i3:1033-2853(-)
MTGWRKWFPFPRPHPKRHETETNELHPVLLIPGIGGSILNAVSNDGKSTERIWVRLYNADQEFRTKLWSKYNAKTGKTESLDPSSHIEVPEDNYGLYSCDILDPDVSVPLDAVCYYHHMIREMRTWGFKDGENLFGFGYDFRQSNRLPETLDRLRRKLRDVVASTGRRVDVVTHSMGGLLFKSFLALHPDECQQLVRKWVAIAAPFRGAPGFILDTLLTGVEFLKGWQKSLFITKWTMHQLMVECPSVYELIADYSFDWEEAPELRIVRRRTDDDDDLEIDAADGLEGLGIDDLSSRGGGDSDSDSDGSSSADGRCRGRSGSSIRSGSSGRNSGGAAGDGAVVEQRFRHLPDILRAMEQALHDNAIEVGGKTVPLPFNHDICEWAKETRRIWSKASLPPTVEFYTIYGTGLDTPFHSQYGSQKEPLKDISDILHCDATFQHVDGDGTVPVESALGDGLNPLFRVGVPTAEHRELLRLPRVFSLLHFFLEVGGKDPMYDPHTDFVLVPRMGEMGMEVNEGERCMEEKGKRKQEELKGREERKSGDLKHEKAGVVADVTVHIDIHCTSSARGVETPAAQEEFAASVAVSTQASVSSNFCQPEKAAYLV